MNLSLDRSTFYNTRSNKIVKNLINELKEYFEGIKVEKEETQLNNSMFDENKIITKFRDKMLIERAHILNDYAKQTLDKGEMYYIYDKNSKLEDAYNLCICEDGKNHTIIEERKVNLPERFSNWEHIKKKR